MPRVITPLCSDVLEQVFDVVAVSNVRRLVRPGTAAARTARVGARLSQLLLEFGRAQLPRVDQHLVEIAKSNSNMAGEFHYDDSRDEYAEMRRKDFNATIEFLHKEGCDTAAFFLQDEMKRFF